ncbi:MAG: hypothetical protein NTZ34_07520 [Chloroflexi bacterium]|nr:hypothetical protein [Chloroflexota bacterium]
MLLDNILPVYDFTEVHSIRIRACAEAVFKALKEVTPAEISVVMRVLFSLRSFPEKFAGRQGLDLTNQEPLLSQMMKRGFIMLAEQPPEEFVFGMIVPGSIGRVWRKSSALLQAPSSREEFLAYKYPDCLLVVANFLVTDAEQAGFVTVRTESRTKALSEQARKNFTPYWRIIRPFSGLIRRVWLSAIKRRAEMQCKP